MVVIEMEEHAGNVKHAALTDQWFGFPLCHSYQKCPAKFFNMWVFSQGDQWPSQAHSIQHTQLCQNNYVGGVRAKGRSWDDSTLYCLLPPKVS